MTDAHMRLEARQGSWFRIAGRCRALEGAPEPRGQAKMVQWLVLSFMGVFTNLVYGTRPGVSLRTLKTWGSHYPKGVLTNLVGQDLESPPSDP